MNIRFGVLALVLAGFAVAQRSGYRLVVSGQVSSEQAIVVSGRSDSTAPGVESRQLA